MKHIVSLSAVLTAVWLAWSGHFELLTLGLGAGSVLCVIALSNRMHLVDTEGALLGLRLTGLLLYLPWLAWEIVKANLDVARLILSPGAPKIAPRIIRVRASQRSEVGRVLYANSITLTPGTISIDVGDGEILVHALHEDAAKGVAAGTMDRKCASLEKDSA